MVKRSRLTAVNLECALAGPIDLQVEGGECLALTGRSGAGKSVALRMLADLVPHRGQLALDGVPVAAMSGPQWRRMVRYAAAEPGWWARTLGDHLRRPTGARLHRLCLSPDILERPVEAVSTGQRQRIAFLRAIEDAPRVLLLDEPTSALDAEATAALEGILRELMADGLAVILVSHDEAQVARLAQRTLHLASRP